MAKILISPGYAGGWSTWNDDKIAEFMLTYAPIIEYLEAHPETHLNENDDVVKQMLGEIYEKFDVDDVCVLGVKNLKVEEVFGRFTIVECEGYESIQYLSEIKSYNFD